MNYGLGEGGSKGRSGLMGQGWEQHTEPAQKGCAGSWEPLRNYRCTGAQNDLGWKGPLKIIYSIPPAVGRDNIHQIRLLKASSSLTLNTSDDGAPTASLFQCLTTL